MICIITEIEVAKERVPLFPFNHMRSRTGLLGNANKLTPLLDFSCKTKLKVDCDSIVI